MKEDKCARVLPKLPEGGASEPGVAGPAPRRRGPRREPRCNPR